MGNNLKDRLKLIAERENVSQRLFSKSLGQSVGWLANASSTVSSDALINLFIKYPKYSWRWILFGEGDILKADIPQNDENQEKKIETGKLSEMYKEELAELRQENSKIRASFLAMMECNARLIQQVTSLQVGNIV